MSGSLPHLVISQPSDDDAETGFASGQGDDDDYDDPYLANIDLNRVRKSIFDNDADEGPDILQINPEDNPEAFVTVPPDGGWGWMVVFASFVNNVILDGISYAFGILLVELVGHFKESTAKVSIIGSLLVGICLLVGPISGALVNRFGCRKVWMGGATMGFISFFISSQVNSINMLILTYGIMGGFSFGIMYLPTIVSVSYYFDSKRAVATGLAVSGSGVGCFIFGPFIENMLRVYDWSNTMMILSGIVFNCAVLGSLVRELEPPVKLEKIAKKSFVQKMRSCCLHENKLDRSDDEIGNSLYVSQHKLGGSTLDDAIMQHVLRYMETTDNAATKPFYRSQQEVSKMKAGSITDLENRALNDQLKTKSQNSSKDGNESPKGSPMAHSTPNLNDKVAHPAMTEASHLMAYKVQLPNKVVNSEDYRRPLYRKDIFYSGSIYNLNRVEVPSNVKVHRKKSVSGTSWAGSSFALSMTRIPGVTEDYRRKSKTKVQKKPSVWGKIKHTIPKAVQDVIKNMTNILLFKNSAYAIIWLGNIFVMIGFYVPSFFLLESCLSYGISKEKGALLLCVSGITSTVGRLFFGWLTTIPRMTPLLVNNITLIIAGIAVCFIPLFTTFPLLVMFCVIYGLCAAPIISLASVILCDLVGLEALTNAFGLIILGRGISGTIGPPLASMISSHFGTLNAGYYLSGSMIIIGGLLHCILHLPYYQKQAKKVQEELSMSQALFQRSVVQINEDE